MLTPVWFQIQQQQLLLLQLSIILKHEVDDNNNCKWCARNNTKRIGKGTGGLGNKRTSGNHPAYSIIKIGQNTKKSSGDLRRLAITQTQVENHQQTLG